VHQRSFALSLLAAGALHLPLALAAIPPAAQKEIDALLAQIVSSQCRFYRNGAWHDAAAAKAHMERKLARISQIGTLRRTEDFITYAATQSSMSGERYKIACAGQSPQDAQAWMQSQLSALRARP
jgi:hypothetical protein